MDRAVGHKKWIWLQSHEVPLAKLGVNSTEQWGILWCPDRWKQGGVEFDGGIFKGYTPYSFVPPLMDVLLLNWSILVEIVQ